MCQETSSLLIRGLYWRVILSQGDFIPHTHKGHSAISGDSSGTTGRVLLAFGYWHCAKHPTMCRTAPQQNYPARRDNQTCFRAEFPNYGTFGLVGFLIWVCLFPVRSLTDAEVKDLLGSDSPLSVIRNVKEKWAWGGFPTVRFNVGAGCSLQWSCPTRPAVVVPLAGICSGQYLPVATLPVKIFFFIEVKFS